MKEPTKEEVTAAHNELARLMKPLRDAPAGTAIPLTPEMMAQVNIIMYQSNKATYEAIKRIRETEHRYPRGRGLRFR